MFFLSKMVFVFLSSILKKITLFFSLQLRYCNNNNNNFCYRFLSQIDNNLYRLLFSSWQYLEEIYLGYAKLNNHNLKSLTQCKNLKKLYFYMMEIKPPNSCSIIFEQCHKLQQSKFKYCNISNYLNNQWKEKYPHITIKVSKSICNNEE